MEASLHLSPSDELLAQRLQAGDTAAFDELYRRYARPLAAYGARILKDTAAGEDVAQTALLRAYQSIRGGTEPEHVRAWLYTIAQRVAFDSRSKGRDELTYDGELDGRADGSFATRSSRAELIAAVRALPERQRRAYLLREVQGLSIGEIAEELDLTDQQVQQAIFAARNKLAEQLSFGGRLTCTEVRAADRHSLDLGQRRALKAHLRACPECRTATGGRVGWLGGFGLVSALRDLIGGFFGGGGALGVAKVGTALAVAGLGVATPTVAARVARPTLHPAARLAEPAAAVSTPHAPAAEGPTPVEPTIASAAPLAVPQFFSALRLRPPARQWQPVPGLPADPPAAPVETPAAPADETPAPADTQPTGEAPVDEAQAAADEPAPADPAADDPEPTDPAADAAPADPPADEEPPTDGSDDLLPDEQPTP